MTILRPSRCVLLLFCIGALPAVFLRSLSAADDSRPAARVLIVTGEDYPGHKWKETCPVVKAELEKDPRLSVQVLDDLKALAAASLADYQVVVVHFKNYDPQVPGRKGLDNLTRFVENGGGLVVLHFGCGAFQEFKDDFAKIAGRVWFGEKTPPGRRNHDPRGPFTVNIAAADHPVTRGMNDFTTDDELYSCLVGDLPVTTLATAVSKIDGVAYPMAFVFQCGKGRVFHSVLGHDAAAFGVAGTAELHRRGCVWAAGLEPVPAKK
ncbi:MAG: ThuA domain-containing protein [Thermoguttaceae bacterium]